MWDIRELAVASVVLLIFAATIIPIVLGFGHARRTRELEHAERMKALELGRQLPGEVQDEPWTMSSRLALSIGAGVPIAIFGCAWMTSMAVGYHEAIWIASALVGSSGVICGSILGAQSNSSRKAAASRQNSKPYVEEDAYDVVAARG